MNDVATRLADILTRVKMAERASGRSEGAVALIAVTKTYPAATIREAYDAGHRRFGENRVQELENKAPLLPKDIEWHLIGHLQSNKAAKAVELAAYIHSVDSEKLVQRLDRLAGELGKRPKILLEVNISGEASKEGLTPSELPSVAAVAAAAKHLELKGLMTMAPLDADAATLDAVFNGLGRLRDETEKKLGISLPELSMGMSSDFEAAIAAGATMVRVGSAIFGHRGG